LIALTVKPEHCTGCMACVYACSLAHEEVFSLGLSRMRIEKEEALGLSVPVACLVCEGMPCVETCPVGAIRVDAELGRPVIHEGECTGCGACVEVCPVGAIRIHNLKGTVFVCDMCSGEPQCVRVCVSGALSLREGAQSDPAISGRVARDAALREIGRSAR
jgi:carbon-monoxide dehydrogenase iron sulfur subunit